MDSTLAAENKHLHQINKIFTYVLLAHIPVAIAFSFIFNTSLLLAVTTSLLIALFPGYMTFFTKSHRAASISHGIAMMFTSALLIHLGRGMIELHFHIFVGLAVMIVFANPWVILAGALTIAVHHVGFFLLLPASVFNYKASFGIVVVHAVFVVLQTGPCMWIAQKFRGYIIEQGMVVAQIDDIFKLMNEEIHTLTTTNRNLTESSSLQSSAVSETAQTIHQISAMASQTSENAAHSKEISNNTKGKAEYGKNIVKLVSEALGKIKNSNDSLLLQVNSNKEQLVGIVDTIKQIEVKTNIINEIVFQTKLLSFNASVEAARAGEHGKGFSVVAEEIGNLATTSGSASKEINDLINSSVQKVQLIATTTDVKVSELTNLSMASIKEGENQVNTCGVAFEELTNYINDLNELVNGISKASQEQSVGVNEITQVINQLADSNIKNHDSLEASMKASEHLSTLSESLGELVEKLNSKTAA